MGWQFQKGFNRYPLYKVLNPLDQCVESSWLILQLQVLNSMCTRVECSFLRGWIHYLQVLYLLEQSVESWWLLLCLKVLNPSPYGVESFTLWCWMRFFSVKSSILRCQIFNLIWSILLDGTFKGTVAQDFSLQVFSWIICPRPRILTKVHGYFCKSRCPNGIENTGQR